MNKKIHRKLLSVILSFNLLLQSIAPLLVIPVYAEDSTPSADTLIAVLPLATDQDPGDSAAIPPLRLRQRSK
ncbi:MAG: hypothetical protein UW41_C0003G0034 [Candidatus Collierbacteria bacterium GW2011_GWC2_44_18]|uniref:Uncharacterized protein n=1 Tax=Candidatus Collierbacteria bacterium GW2011_GWC2_44_18 TaxID=1618392 RepID=A0A0G1K0L2_9BACT|nr:MAG: hypothetical protein UW41_C0003G0034 [Candidatus Collierbacteria bacterium GW2011_GWC2_44_18]